MIYWNLLEHDYILFYISKLGYDEIYYALVKYSYTLAAVRCVTNSLILCNRLTTTSPAEKNRQGNGYNCFVASQKPRNLLRRCTDAVVPWSRAQRTPHFVH